MILKKNGPSPNNDLKGKRNGFLSVEKLRHSFVIIKTSNLFNLTMNPTKFTNMLDNIDVIIPKKNLVKKTINDLSPMFDYVSSLIVIDRLFLCLWRLDPCYCSRSNELIKYKVKWVGKPLGSLIILNYSCHQFHGGYFGGRSGVEKTMVVMVMGVAVAVMVVIIQQIKKNKEVVGTSSNIRPTLPMFVDGPRHNPTIAALTHNNNTSTTNRPITGSNNLTTSP